MGVCAACACRTKAWQKIFAEIYDTDGLRIGDWPGDTALRGTSDKISIERQPASTNHHTQPSGSRFTCGRGQEFFDGVARDLRRSSALEWPTTIGAKILARAQETHCGEESSIYIAAKVIPGGENPAASKRGFQQPTGGLLQKKQKQAKSVKVLHHFTRISRKVPTLAAEGLSVRISQ